MFTYSERDMHRMPAPIKTHLPIKADILNSGIMEEDAAGRENEADPNLARLPAPALHGTFAKAYALLTRLASKIGWDDLLKCRSQVFVMEEEYRLQKAKEDVQKSSTSLNEQEQESEPQQETKKEEQPQPEEEQQNKDEEEEEEQPQQENGDVHEEHNSEAENAEDDEDLADQMDNVDLNADENEDEPANKVEVKHTPLSRPTQAAEDQSKVRNSTMHMDVKTHVDIEHKHWRKQRSTCRHTSP